MRVLRLAILSALMPLAVGAWRTAAAQDVTGVVRDQEDDAIRDAIVRLLPSGMATRTDSRGRFRLVDVAVGSHRVVTTKFGFRPDTGQVTVQAGGTATVDIKLERLDALDPVVINATRALLPRVVDRANRGLGAAIYADDIQRLGLMHTIDVIMTSPKLALAAGDRPVIFVDGRPLRHPMDMPQPDEVAAIEAHRGLMGVKEPDLWLPSWMNYSTDRRLVLVWTRRYVLEQERRGVP